jgi:hypothetical protein
MTVTRTIRPAILATLALAACGVVAHAHRPLAIGGPHPDAASALQIKDISISQVAYAELTPAAPQLWLTFFLAEPDELRVSLGVPSIERLKRYAPVLAVLGPWMGSVAVPFPLFDGLGGVVLAPRSGARDTFFEPFTGTASWTLVEAVIPLPAAGRYYIVAYAPQDARGKLWVAVGSREVYGAQDLLRLPTIVREVRAFHELPAGAPPGLLNVGLSAVALVAVLAGVILLLGLL